MRVLASIDIVTRLYDLADLSSLNRLVFSIMAQADVGPLRLHVMLQRFSSTDVQSIRRATRELRQLHDSVSVTLHNWDYPAPFDLRVPLLNWGLEVAQGRYFTYLDVYDQLYPHACTTLMARLLNTTTPIALGGYVLRSILSWGDVVLPLSDQEDVPFSTPFFIIDRHRVATKDCMFRNVEHNSVDEFVTRICTVYEADTKHRTDIVAVRQYPQ